MRLHDKEQTRHQADCVFPKQAGAPILSVSAVQEVEKFLDFSRRVVFLAWSGEVHFNVWCRHTFSTWDTCSCLYQRSRSSQFYREATSRCVRVFVFDRWSVPSSFGGNFHSTLCAHLLVAGLSSFILRQLVRSLYSRWFQGSAHSFISVVHLAFLVVWRHFGLQPRETCRDFSDWELFRSVEHVEETASVQLSMQPQQSESVPFEEYFPPEAFTSAGELVPGPVSVSLHDITPKVMEACLLVRKAAEALHLDLEVLSLLVHELGGRLERDHGF